MGEGNFRILISVTLLLIFFIFTIPGGHAAISVPVNPPNVDWYHEYPVWGFDQGFVQTADGGYIVVGDSTTTNSASVIIKMDRNGTIESTQEIYGITNAHLSSIRPTRDGFIISGITSKNSADYSTYKIFLVKLDAAGNIQWTNAFGGPGGEGASDARETFDGGYIVAGFSKSYSHYNEGYVAKTDSRGNKVWDTHFGDSESNDGSIILTAPDGGYLILSYQEPLGQLDPATARTLIIKMDGNGSYAWTSTVGNGESPRIVDMTFADDGNILLSGTTSSPGNNIDGKYLAEYSLSGGKQWEKTLTGSGLDSDSLDPLEVNGGYVLTGLTNQSTYLARVDQYQYQIWKKVLELSRQRGFSTTGLRRAADGGYLLFGLTSPEEFPQSRSKTVFELIKLGGERYPGILSLDSAQYETTVNTTLTIQVKRSDGKDDNISVEYWTENDSALTGVDFLPAKGTLSFNDSETTKTINLTVLHGNYTDTNRSFSLRLSNVTGGAALGDINATQVTILYPSAIQAVDESQGNLPFLGGNYSIPGFIKPGVIKVPSLEKILTTLLALFTGIFFLIFWPWLLKLLQFIYDAIKSYLQKLFSVKEAQLRDVKVKPRKKWLFGISRAELLVGIACALLIGITFTFARDALSDPYKLLVIVIAAALTIVVSELVRRYFASRYSAATEYQFWGVGALTLIITAIFHQPFSRPARTIVDKNAELGPKKLGIIAMAPCVASLALSIVFLLLLGYGNGFETLGKEGFKMGMMICVYSLMPFEPMDGKRVIGWSKTAWGIVFIPALLFYLGMLLFIF